MANYNYKRVRKFLDTVNKEAEIAAQKVYDKHNAKLVSIIEQEMGKGHSMYAGMGTLYFENRAGVYVGENMANELIETQYHAKLQVGFDIKDIHK